MKMRTIGLMVLTALVTGLLALASGATAQERPRAPRWEPAGDTVVSVEGDADYGFTIHHYDGTVLSPPTLSETTAECSGVRHRGRAGPPARWRSETWFRDLASLQGRDRLGDGTTPGGPARDGEPGTVSRRAARLSRRRPRRPGSARPARGRR